LRVLILDTYYAAFVTAHYAARPELASASYGDQHAALMAECFGTGDAYSHFLRALGHEAAEIVVDCEPLQFRWARERRRFAAERRVLAKARGVARRQAVRWLLRRIAMAQLDEFGPDVLYCQNLDFLSRAQLDRIRARGILVAGQIASPAPGDDQLRGYDLILTSFPHFVPRFRALGVQSEELRLAVDARVLDRVRDRGGDPAPTAPREHEIVFVGGVHPTVHRRGTELLERLCARYPIAVWGYGADALPAGSAIRRSYRGEAWGLEMYRVLADARVALNRHIDVAEGHANNMRLYEATGMGAALLTDAGSNLSDLFSPSREVAAYRDLDELVATLDRLLGDDEERLAIASAGQRRTLNEHTFERRMEELAAILMAHVGALPARRPRRPRLARA
jgi:spore maturation protein CgeB